MSAPPPPVGAVRLGDLDRTEPVSRHFGGDRGTPLDRRYIEAFLRRHAPDIRGRALEIGEDRYTRAFGGDRVTAADVLEPPGRDNPRATVTADLQDGAGVPEGAYDVAIVTQTLHMLYDVHGAVRTLHRALKPGGVALATVPGVTSIDSVDGPDKWFWPMTQTAARRLFADAFGPGAVTVETFGNVYAATAFLQGLAAEELDAAKLAVVDPLYPVVTGIRAVKA